MGNLVKVDFKTRRYEYDIKVSLNRLQHIGASAVLSNRNKDLHAVMNTVGFVWLNDSESTDDLELAQAEAEKNCALMDQILELNELETRFNERIKKRRQR